ncbi:ATP-binding cassette domain-containing protein [Desulfovibrio piger]|uniref:ATP-binding cassette domain-containing protein n=1 Tax=Desulfovibrio TaxID=872 RepID=UPI002614C2BE|nr:ABC transporter ATP-binding protein [Desulfovibrio piger]MCI7405357.1 ABC transporter ATP-binding protein [Desulfovibrio piger]
MNHGHPVPLLELRHVSVTEGLSGRPLVQDVSFSLQRGHCLGIVGESGSGKSLLCRALLGLLPSGLVRSGQLHFDGRDLGRLDPAGWRELRGTGMAVILQQAMTAFDPLRPLGKQLEGALRDRGRMSAARAREAVCEALQRVDLPETVLSSYPHQLSGGMLQRCMIALTLALRPALVVADEPTTALDACHQQQVLRCLADVARDASLIFVSHDLGAVQQLADEVLVMQAGRCVEYGQAAQLFDTPGHACTRHLVRTRLALWRGFRQALGDR